MNESDQSVSTNLAEALEKYKVAEPPRADAIEQYCRLLWDWNEKINLTRHTDFDKFVTRDLFDAMRLSELLQPGEEVLDLGSGGGVPGVLLALLRDDLDVSLSDSVGKKAKVLEAIARELDLPCPVYPDRAENVMLEMRYTTVTARAVGPLTKLMKWLQPCWHSAGRLLAIKGPRWISERADARHAGLMHGFQLTKEAEYTTPGTDVQNVILQVKPEIPMFVGNRSGKRRK